MNHYHQNPYIALLQRLIETPSLSKQEDQTADILCDFLAKRGVDLQRLENNVWATNLHFDSAKPSILLNSHHDTVPPNGNYTRDPHAPDIEGDTLYGLGSNDAGGSVVALIATFLEFYDKKSLNYNLVLAITAQEECSGSGGVEMLLPVLREKCANNIAFAIVGEPTCMEMAVAERGLMVVDCKAHGVAGHAAREVGVNAIYKALADVEWFRTYRFERVSAVMGEVKMNVTVIGAGERHNIVPHLCEFTIDIRINELYSHQEILDIISENITSEFAPRSTRLRSSSIPEDHPIVLSGKALGRKTFGSPTTSDSSLIHDIPCLKMGPGDSDRSHSSDEYIGVGEVLQGIELYVGILDGVL